MDWTKSLIGEYYTAEGGKYAITRQMFHPINDGVVPLGETWSFRWHLYYQSKRVGVYETLEKARSVAEALHDEVETDNKG